MKKTSLHRQKIRAGKCFCRTILISRASITFLIALLFTLPIKAQQVAAQQSAPVLPQPLSMQVLFGSQGIGAEAKYGFLSNLLAFPAFQRITHFQQNSPTCTCSLITPLFAVRVSGLLAGPVTFLGEMQA
jgi:hypothetical protein